MPPVVSGERRTIPGSLLHHLLNGGIVKIEAMLDGIAASVEGAMQAFAAIGVAGDLLVPAVGFINNGLQFLNGERGLGEEFVVLIHPGAMGHVNLHPIHAVRELLAGGFARLDRAVNNLHAFGQNVLDLRGVAFQGISASGGNGAPGGNIALFNRLLDSQIAVAGAFGFQVANSGEALLQSAAGGNGRAGSAIRQGIVQKIYVVAALGGIFALQIDVGVGINHAGQHGGAREIDELGPLRDFGRSPAADACDAIAAHHDHLIAARLAGHAVNQHAGADNGDALGRWRGLGEGRTAKNQNNCQRLATKFDDHRLSPGELPMIASASISTNISGAISLLTSTMLVAGRISRKNSP